MLTSTLLIQLQNSPEPISYFPTKHTATRNARERAQGSSIGTNFAIFPVRALDMTADISAVQGYSCYAYHAEKWGVLKPHIVYFPIIIVLLSLKTPSNVGR